MTIYASMNAARRGYADRYQPDSAFPGIMPTNVILDTARDYDSGDAWGESSELLYALHRLWSDYQSPAMGTSPIDAWDAGDDIPLYDDIAEYIAANDIPADDAARMIQHATRVAEHWSAQARLAGRNY